MSRQNLKYLIANMDPVLNPGKYVFSTVKDIDEIPRSITICEMVEKEGTTVVLKKEDADRLGLAYNYVAAWITLNVESDLDAVGLTAAFSNELAANHISCNVIAGYFHDHIFVDVKDGQKALEVLRKMTKNYVVH